LTGDWTATLLLLLAEWTDGSHACPDSPVRERPVAPASSRPENWPPAPGTYVRKHCRNTCAAAPHIRHRVRSSSVWQTFHKFAGRCMSDFYNKFVQVPFSSKNFINYPLHQSLITN
jgi:hypothetical protein